MLFIEYLCTSDQNTYQMSPLAITRHLMLPFLSNNRVTSTAIVYQLSKTKTPIHSIYWKNRRWWPSCKYLLLFLYSSNRWNGLVFSFWKVDTQLQLPFLSNNRVTSTAIVYQLSKTKTPIHSIYWKNILCTSDQNTYQMSPLAITRQ
jgi:hypothetical protein